eukprot:72805-Rhodomonas_salina.1
MAYCIGLSAPAMSGTDLAKVPMCYAMSSTEMAYGHRAHPRSQCYLQPYQHWFQVPRPYLEPT